MVEKVDIDATRAAILAAYDAIKVDPSLPSEEQDTIRLMKRAAKMIAEVQVFSIGELEREAMEVSGGGTTDFNSFRNIGSALATALFSACACVRDEEEVGKGEMTASHKAIHVLTEIIDRHMHELYYTTYEGKDDGHTYHHSNVEIVRKNVGDA